MKSENKGTLFHFLSDSIKTQSTTHNGRGTENKYKIYGIHFALKNMVCFYFVFTHEKKKEINFFKTKSNFLYFLPPNSINNFGRAMLTEI